MLYDMNRNIVEDALLLPLLLECEEVFPTPDSIKDPSQFLAAIKGVFVVSIGLSGVVNSGNSMDQHINRIQRGIKSPYKFVDLRNALSNILDIQANKNSEKIYEDAVKIMNTLSNSFKLIRANIILYV
jgi:hypothetical protein